LRYSSRGTQEIELEATRIIAEIEKTEGLKHTRERGSRSSEVAARKASLLMPLARLELGDLLAVLFEVGHMAGFR
jgi:hypothetical protein